MDVPTSTSEILAYMRVTIPNHTCSCSKESKWQVRISKQGEKVAPKVNTAYECQHVGHVQQTRGL